MGVKKIVVVGAGPAGMMAAIRAGELLQEEVVLIEKNHTLGKKLLLSGKGRCNLTNACNLDSFIDRFSKNGQFLRDAFKTFFNSDLINFFQNRGLRLKAERQSRVFPVTDKSNSILKVLQKELQKNKVKIIYRREAKGVCLEDNRVEGLLLSDKTVVPTDRIILATGGISYGFTGSNGDGIDIARRLGHNIVELRPGLVPLETSEDYPNLLEGLTLRNIRLRFVDGEHQIISDIGELLFTGFGISGPLVLSLSGQIVDWLSPVRSKSPKATTMPRRKTSNGKDNNNVYVEIDLKPALSRQQLHMRLLREFRLNPRKGIKNTLKNLLPSRMIAVFLNIAKISPNRKVSQVRKDERRNLCLLFKAFRLNITKSRPIDEAMITRGGVCLKDINPRTMESRKICGLYFAGEMIDVDADTGGFNLQAAFSTGYLAGESAALT